MFDMRSIKNSVQYISGFTVVSRITNWVLFIYNVNKYASTILLNITSDSL